MNKNKLDKDVIKGFYKSESIEEKARRILKYIIITNTFVALIIASIKCGLPNNKESWTNFMAFFSLNWILLFFGMYALAKIVQLTRNMQ